ncbi:hypothetical protein PIB30_028177 [Stylosanthes scabra]|uniref:DUF4283 domain-containing protein n=1 Tax=Stylosanthes scabra TaxID=79078 RepID=A0ABU6QAB5_9FABA|nr:hypothetical protein [Stylosanthes scabra]
MVTEQMIYHGNEARMEEKGRERNITQPERSYKNVVLEGQRKETILNLTDDNQLYDKSKSMVALERDDGLQEKLAKSISREFMGSMDYDSIKEVVMKDWCKIKEVRLIGPMKTLITFDTKENMEVVLNSLFLLNHFFEIRRWSPNEGGAVIGVDGDRDHQMGSFKALIDTSFGPTVQAILNVTVDENEFLLFIKEGGSERVVRGEDEGMKKHGVLDDVRSLDVEVQSGGRKHTGDKGGQDNGNMNKADVRDPLGTGKDDNSKFESIRQAETNVTKKAKTRERHEDVTEEDKKNSRMRTWKDDRTIEEVVQDTCANRGIGDWGLGL